jgi:hypothetical protein
MFGDLDALLTTAPIAARCVGCLPTSPAFCPRSSAERVWRPLSLTSGAAPIWFRSTC